METVGMVAGLARRWAGIRPIFVVLTCAFLPASLPADTLVFRRPMASVMTLTESTFHEAVAPGCGNANAVLEGAVERVGSRLTLRTTKSTRGDEGEARSLVLVTWGQWTYLVEEESALAFCNAVNVGEEPDGALMIGKRGFWRLQGDDERPRPEVTSFPSVPVEWERYFVREKLTSVTGPLAGKHSRFIDLGSDDGVFEGLEFIVRDVPVDPALFGDSHVDRIAIVSRVETRRSIIEYRNYNARIARGLAVASGVHNVPGPPPQLGEQEVLRVADQAAEAELGSDESFDLKWYPARSARYDSRLRAWWVHYLREPDRHPGDHFTIRVDDQTRETTFHGGR